MISFYQPANDKCRFLFLIRLVFVRVACGAIYILQVETLWVYKHKCSSFAGEYLQA